MSDGYEYEIWQDDCMVAGVFASSDEDALRELKHYVSQYMADGPLRVCMVSRTFFPDDAVLMMARYGGSIRKEET